MDFSLFYFAGRAAGDRQDRYRLLLDGARFADEHGFAAVWTPERHFHPFGGLYPNPSVTASAVAAVTRRVGVRAGSVVCRCTTRCASRRSGRWWTTCRAAGSGVSFASGWHADDFGSRRRTTRTASDVLRRRGIETSPALARRGRAPDGTAAGTADGAHLPAAGPARAAGLAHPSATPETYRLPGEIGAGVLTHLMGQTPRSWPGRSRSTAGRWPRTSRGEPGEVALMLHTFVGPDRDEVREIVREPFSEYLRSSIGPDRARVRRRPARRRPEQPVRGRRGVPGGTVLRPVLRHRRPDGRPRRRSRRVRRLHGIGVDEVACLIDFVGDVDAVLAALPHLDRLKDTFGQELEGR